MSDDQAPKDYKESFIHLEYQYTAGSATTTFLNQVKEGRLVGQSCPKCKAVYVPPRGSCPRCGIATSIEVPLTDKGCVESFTVVHIPIPGNPIVPPYVGAPQKRAIKEPHKMPHRSNPYRRKAIHFICAGKKDIRPPHQRGKGCF